MKLSKAEGLAAGLCAGALAFFALQPLLTRPAGEHYTVSGAAPAQAQPSQAARFYVPDELVDVNTAPLEELLTLPGIGQARAQAILDDRAENGPFASGEELTRVPGIGEAICEAVAPYITVSSPGKEADGS